MGRDDGAQGHQAGDSHSVWRVVSLPWRRRCRRSVQARSRVSVAKRRQSVASVSRSRGEVKAKPPKPPKPAHRPVVYATVPRLWPDSTIVCIGGGPSLTAEDVAFVQGKARVIAVNDAHRLAPWADVLYGCDSRWWDWNRGVPDFSGLKYSLQKASLKWRGVQVLQITGPFGLERKPNGLKTGRNGGYQAINLAFHLGAKRILLLGYDMQYSSSAKTHWFGNHPGGGPPPVQPFRG